VRVPTVVRTEVLLHELTVRDLAVAGVKRCVVDTGHFLAGDEQTRTAPLVVGVLLLLDCNALLREETLLLVTLHPHQHAPWLEVQRVLWPVIALEHVVAEAAVAATYRP